MRLWIPVAVAALVVLAGCGSTSQPARTPTVSPAPVPDAGTRASVPAASPTTSPSVPTVPPATSRSSTAPYPPGVTVAGIESLTALARAHRTALANRSYRRVLATTRSVGGDRVRRRRVVRVRSRTVYHLREIRTVRGNGTAGAVTERVAYADGRTLYARCGPTERPTACPVGRPHADETHAAGTVLGLLSGANSTVSGPFGRGDGLRYRVTATGVPVDIGSPYGVTRVTDYTATALVEPSGLVTAIDASYELVRGDRRIRVVVALRFARVGRTRVTPPPWYRPNATGTATPPALASPGRVDRPSPRPTRSP